MTISILVSALAPQGASSDHILPVSMTPPSILLSPGHNNSGSARIASADGRYFAFTSDDRASAAEGGPAATAIYFQDQETGHLRIVSHAVGTPERPCNGYSINPEISRDGRFVLFSSTATDLTEDIDTNDEYDVFLWDRDTGLVTLVSRPMDGNQSGNGASTGGVISSDGNWVAFSSTATDLLDVQDDNSNWDVFRWSRATGSMQLVSHSAASPTEAGNAGSSNSRISGDGKAVTFATAASNLVPGADGPSQLMLWSSEDDTHRLVSHATSGANHASNGHVFQHEISDDGSAVTFLSRATDLVPGTDSNSLEDVFHWDRTSNEVRLVSHVLGEPSRAAGAARFDPQISHSGDTVAFTSGADNMVAGSDTNGAHDVFLWTSGSGSIELLSHSLDSPGTAGNGRSAAPHLSADGNRVAFTSNSTNLVSGDADNDLYDSYLWARGQPTRLVSHSPLNSMDAVGGGVRSLSSDGGTVFFSSIAPDLIPIGSGPGYYSLDVGSDLISPRSLADQFSFLTWADSSAPTISADGRFVAYLSTGSLSHAYLWDRLTGRIELVSHSLEGPFQPGNDSSYKARISRDGRFVAFVSRATDLVDGTDNNNGLDVFLWSRETKAITLVSHAQGAIDRAGNGSSSFPSLDAGGRFVSFSSGASDLTSVSDTNSSSDLFLWDRTSGEIQLVSRAAQGPSRAVGSHYALSLIAEDGGAVVFGSSSSELVAGSDTNGSNDLFRWSREDDTMQLISHTSASNTTTGNGDSWLGSMSADGSVVAFSTAATNLLETTNSADQVLLWDATTSTLELVSHASTSPQTGANQFSSDPVVSADGNTVAFVSPATDLGQGSDQNSGNDVFVWDRASGAISLVSHSHLGLQEAGNRPSLNPGISADGSKVAFTSYATDLVGGPERPDGGTDVFLWNRDSGSTALVSRSIAGPTIPGNKPSPSSPHEPQTPLFSQDGKSLVFSSWASDLVDGLVTRRYPPNVFLYSEDPTEADISLTLSAPAATTPGGEMDLTATLRNHSQATASRIGLVIDLPRSVSALQFQAGWNCDQVAQRVACLRDTLPPGATRSVGIQLAIPETAGPLVFSGSVTWAGPDLTPTNNRDSASVAIQGGVCTPGPNTACLLGGRFRVEGEMYDFNTPPNRRDVQVMELDGRAESDQAVFLESFAPGNFEVGVKMVDACGLDEMHPLRGFWLFLGGLTNAETHILVEDTAAADTDYLWSNPPGSLAQTIGLTPAFDCDVATAPTCQPDDGTACLLGGRFRITGTTLDFGEPPTVFPTRVMRFSGRAESDQAVFFESFGPGNFEVGVKMVDGCSLPDGHPHRAYWTFYGGLTNARTELRITDLVTGQVDTWAVPAGTFPRSEGRTHAFPCDP